MLSVSGNHKPVSNRPLNNRGQMAVFIALIFQVLFVIFAMAINIGLVVHDKINLQNAVDLAAYYAAERQAEWLNVMAHQNYQIRQSYKLMTWRYRVLGTMGLDSHPSRFANGNLNDVPYSEAVRPTACISYTPVWANVQPGDTACKDTNLNIPAITVAPVIAGFNPINAAYSGFARAMQNRIDSLCQSYGGFNYVFTNLIKFAYRQDQWRLKQSMLAIARNLAQPPEQMIDLNGDQIIVGAQKTFAKNLTFENAQSVQEFKMYNSMNGLQPEQWLNEVRVAINMYYRDVVTGGGCRGIVKTADQFPANASGQSLAARLLGQNPADIPTFFSDPNPESPARMSLGFEKNPWYKLYIGVKAKTKPRQIFFPFGDPVQFEATAYATPFGGRMGPWYKDHWPRGAPSSDGADIDELLPPLVVNSSGEVDPAQLNRLLPNYSRFPGDRIGLMSMLAQASLTNQISNMKGSINFLSGVFDQGPGKTTDILTWAGAPGSASMRTYEVAAVAPDLFDITYYSIEPDFGRTYLPKLRAVMPKLQLGTEFIPRLDLGGRDDEDTLKEFSVEDQMQTVGATLTDPAGGQPPLQRSEAYWYARDRAHMLTSWVHNDVVGKFDSFPDGRYAKCGTWDDDYNHKIPGACLFDGGRTGYSIKLVSGNFLRADGVQYGGANQRGSILNPPPDNW